jgi:hypothetical protein
VVIKHEKNTEIKSEESRYHMHLPPQPLCIDPVSRLRKSLDTLLRFSNAIQTECVIDVDAPRAEPRKETHSKMRRWRLDLDATSVASIKRE